jgi:hypothetical protein
MSNDGSLSKIISYSLFGNVGMFLYGALANAFQCKEHFPDWTMRVYHDDNVPVRVLDCLQELNVELIRVEPDGTYGTFWRFRPLFESGHERVLIRDVDSRITWRDVRCVNEWIESGKKFLVIRDHDEHYKTEIMAGMFGVSGGPLPDSNMNEYAKVHEYISDQIFLKRELWDTMKLDLHECGFRETQWMKDSWAEDGFMGLGFDENEKPRTNHGVMFSVWS